jgi:hypothetical protein
MDRGFRKTLIGAITSVILPMSFSYSASAEATVAVQVGSEQIFKETIRGGALECSPGRYQLLAAKSHTWGQYTLIFNCGGALFSGAYEGEFKKRKNALLLSSTKSHNHYPSSIFLSNAFNGFLWMLNLRSLDSLSLIRIQPGKTYAAGNNPFYKFDNTNRNSYAMVDQSMLWFDAKRNNVLSWRVVSDDGSEIFRKIVDEYRTSLSTLVSIAHVGMNKQAALWGGVDSEVWHSVFDSKNHKIGRAHV